MQNISIIQVEKTQISSIVNCVEERAEVKNLR